MVKKRNALVSAYSDSENEDDSIDEEEIEDDASLNGQHEGTSVTEENQLDIIPEPEPCFEDVYGDKDLTILEFHQSLYGKSADEIQIPFPTKRKCPDDLQNKISISYEKVKMGADFNEAIQKRKDLRNPSIYEKLIDYCQIDEMATNYPKEIYDPEPFLQPLSYYEELSRLQREDIEKREREVREAGKVETNKKSATSSSSGNEKRTKWDSAAPNAFSSAALAALSKAQMLQINKPKVISAFGTANKKK